MASENWFEKHKVLSVVLIIVAVILVLGIIFSFMTPKDKSSYQKSDNSASSNNLQNSNNNGYLECSSDADCSSNEQCKGSKCITIVRTDTLGHSRSSPAPINTPLTIHFGYSWGQLTDAEITLLNVKRGDSAWSAIKEANMFNEAPKDGKEYLLVKFNVKILKTSDDKSYSLSGYSFDAVSQNGAVYDNPFVLTPEPQLSGDLYAGASKEGWVAFLIDQSDTSPLISFNRDQNGQDELWFNLK